MLLNSIMPGGRSILLFSSNAVTVTKTEPPASMVVG
jgi:hypothetical protein